MSIAAIAALVAGAGALIGGVTKLVKVIKGRKGTSKDTAKSAGPKKA